MIYHCFSICILKIKLISIEISCVQSFFIKLAFTSCGIILRFLMWQLQQLSKVSSWLPIRNVIDECQKADDVHSVLIHIFIQLSVIFTFDSDLLVVVSSRVCADSWTE